MIWTPERIQAAEEAFAYWEHTPHRDRMAKQGIGIDCLELMKAATIAAGITPPFVMPYYRPSWGLGRAVNVIEPCLLHCFHCETVPAAEEPVLGDLLVWRVGRQSNHVGIVWYRAGVLGVWHTHIKKGVEFVPLPLEQMLIYRQSFVRFTATGFKADPATINPQDFRK